MRSIKIRSAARRLNKRRRKKRQKWLGRFSLLSRAEIIKAMHNVLEHLTRP